MPADNVTIKALWNVNQYTITFNTDGGSETTSITADYGTAIEAPKAPTKEGYTFAGWENLPETMPADNVTIKALWNINQYTITFNTDGGSETTSITADYGTAIEAPKAPTKEGYTFAGWENLPETMPAENVTVKALWNINQYTITYVTDDNTEYAKFTVNFGEAVTLPEEPTKADYTFMGWAPEVPSSMPANDLVVTAQWKYSYTGWLTEGENTTYLIDGEKAYLSEWATVEGGDYFFDEEGYVAKGISDVPSKDGTYTGRYVFDEETGALCKDINGLYDIGADTYYTEEGEIILDAGVVNIGDDYYYFAEDGKAAKNGTYKVEKTNGLIDEGNYRFDEQGRIIFVLRGDLDDDGDVDNEDAIYSLYNSVFGDEIYPLNQNGDFDGDGDVDNEDAIYLLYFTVFGGEFYPLSDF